MTLDPVTRAACAEALFPEPDFAPTGTIPATLRPAELPDLYIAGENATWPTTYFGYGLPPYEPSDDPQPSRVGGTEA